MSSFKIRPRFKHAFAGEREIFEQKIVNELKNSHRLVFTYLSGQLYIKFHSKVEHFWSPQLHLSFEQEQDKVIVLGLYGPNPTVWAIFFFGYTALGILTLFFGMYGLIRYNLQMDYTILWLIPVFVLLAIVMYVSAQAGQKIGAQQMFEIHHFYEELTGDKIEVD
jgi:hypothetical protein